MSDWFGVLLTLFLLLVNASFVGAEFSFTAIRRDRLGVLLAQGKKYARIVINASEHLLMMLAAAQLGIIITSLLLGKVSEPALAHLLEAPFRTTGIPEPLLHSLNFAIVLLLVSVLYIILSEMVPKNASLADPETVAILLTPTHMVFYKLTKPLLLLFNWLARHALKLFGIEQCDELNTTMDSTELVSVIVESYQGDLLDSEKHVRLRRMLALAIRTVKEVLIPHEQARRVPTALTVSDLETVVTEIGFSRFSATAASNEPGKCRGYVHVKDVPDHVMDPTSNPETVIPDDGIRPVIEIPTETTLDEALRVMRYYNAYVAVVVCARIPKLYLRANAPASIAPRTGAFSGTGQVGVVVLEDPIKERVDVVRDWTHEASPRRSGALKQHPTTNWPRIRLGDTQGCQQ